MEKASEHKMPEIALGEKFSSYDSLKDAVERYQKKNNVVLIVKDSKLLGRVAKTMPKLMDVVNKDVMYYRLAYACEFHGEYRAKGKLKPNHVSKRRGCPMRILLRLAEDLHHLVVYELFEQHNHALEPRNEKHQVFRMARLNSSHYTLTKLEEGQSGELLDVETCIGNQLFDGEEEADGGTTETSTTKTSALDPVPTNYEPANVPVARLISNGSKRVLTEADLKTGGSNSSPTTADLKRRKLLLQNRKLELENKKLELEIKLLERKHDELDQQQQQQQQQAAHIATDGNTFYVSHVFDDSKEGIVSNAGTAAFASTSAAAAEVIKSLTSRGQPIQIITQ